MANLKMIDWYIIDNLPYPLLGSEGENNASTITIQVDELVNDAQYYLDITNKDGDGASATQELTQSTTHVDNNEIYTLSMKPQINWLGSKGAKLLQIRCVYEDNDEQIVKKSNIIHATVNGGVFNSNNHYYNNTNDGVSNDTNTANLFEKYFQKLKTLIENIDVGGSGNTPAPIPSNVEHVYIDMKDENSNGELTISINKYYHIIDSRQTNQGVVKLNVILEPSDIDGDYHFNFISGSPATQLILPNDTLIPSNLSVGTNSYYDMTINSYTHVMVCTSQGLH